jgi:benzoylformate decarboxylase
VVVVVDNGGYLAVKRAIEGYLGVACDDGSHPGTELPGIDHAGVARAYGAEGVDISSAAELGVALQHGLEGERALLIRVPVLAVRP